MIVSLDKNRWLLDWMGACWNKDIYQFMHSVPANQKIHSSRTFLKLFLETKGYKVKITSTEDLLIAMPEEEFIILKLKYQ